MDHNSVENTEADYSQQYSDEYADKSLTNWINPPTVAELKADFEGARISHQSHISNVNIWLDNLHGIGSAKIKSGKNKSKLVPKLIRKQAEWRYAALTEPFLSTDDVFNVSPVTFEDKTAAVQNELVLNNQFNTTIDKVAFIDEYIRTAVDEGTVVVRVGWNYITETNEVEVPITEQQVVTNPITGQQVLEEVQVGTEIQEEINIIKNEPTFYICNYNNVSIDPTCEGDLSKAKFVINSIETSLSDLKKKGGYFNLNSIETFESPSNNPYHETSSNSNYNFNDKPRKKFIMYEYWGFWDIDKTGIVKPIVATYVGNTLIQLKENPYPDGELPFVLVHYLPVRKSVYGEPDGVLLEDNQKIIGAVTRGMIDVMGRSANGQIAIRKDALDTFNRRKFSEGQDYEFNPHVDPRQAFHMHTYPEIPNSAQLMLNMQNAEAESITGIKSFSTGISGAALGDTATGIRSALDASSKRELGILRRLAKGIKEIGRKMIAMNAEFLSDEEIIRITNEEFVAVRRDDLAGNFDLKLAISTAEADNEKASELSFMLQTMGNNMDPALSKIILSDIAKLRKMPDLAKRIIEYQPQPDPLIQKQRKLEIALLEAQVRNENAKGAENEVDVQYKTARTETERAKTRNLDTKSDQENLNFVQKETGQDLKDSLAKRDFDRRTQLDLKAADHVLNTQNGKQPSGSL